MSDRSVRWGRAHRLLTTVGVGVLAGPLLLSATAQAAADKPAEGSITVLKDQWGDGESDKVSKGADGAYQADRDPGSLWTVTKAIGARDVWSQHDAAGVAVTGQGVTVALLDSGVAPVPGLDAAGKLVQGPDLSPETNSDQLTGADSFGRGTHLAGIIVGHDVTELDKRGAPKGAQAGQQLGIAPDARVLAVSSPPPTAAPTSVRSSPGLTG